MRDLERKLNSLKSIKADSKWKESNRSVLLGQISSDKEIRYSWTAVLSYQLPLQLLKAVPHSAMTAAAIVFLLFGGGFVSLQASENSKPGDTLYVAKIVGEKTQLALTFDDKKKAQLNLEFAGNRAKEISQVLNEEANGGKGEKVEKLVFKFREEISALRSHVARISQSSGQEKARPAVQESGTETGVEANQGKDSAPVAEEEYFSAGTSKQENGITTSEESGQPSAPEAAAVLAEQESAAKSASSSGPAEDNASSSEQSAAPDQATAEDIFKQAEELLEKEDYPSLLTKIEEAEKAVQGVENGNIKGESEEATSTDVLIFREASSSPAGIPGPESSTSSQEQP